MKLVYTLLIAVAILPPVQAAEISPELWDRPRSAQAVMAQQAVQQAVAAYQGSATAQMVIIHGARQEAQLQAEELRAWLVALAVESSRLQLRADPAVKTVRIEVIE